VLPPYIHRMLTHAASSGTHHTLTG